MSTPLGAALAESALTVVDEIRRISHARNLLAT